MIRKMDLDKKPSKKLQAWMDDMAYRVKVARVGCLLTMAQLAELSGLPLKYIRDLEAGKISPTYKARDKIRKALHRSLVVAMGDADVEAE